MRCPVACPWWPQAHHCDGAVHDLGDWDHPLLFPSFLRLHDIHSRERSLGNPLVSVVRRCVCVRARMPSQTRTCLGTSRTHGTRVRGRMMVKNVLFKHAGWPATFRLWCKRGKRGKRGKLGARCKQRAQRPQALRALSRALRLGLCRSLDARSNQLSGSITDSIATLTTLTYLDLYVHTLCPGSHTFRLNESVRLVPQMIASSCLLESVATVKGVD